MRILLGCFCAAIALAGCDDVSTYHVVEMVCVNNTGFDAERLCIEPAHPGAELEILVSEKIQKVWITIIKVGAADYNDHWGVKDKMFDNCSVLDRRNWRCTDGHGLIVPEYGMYRGRYYYSYTGGSPPDYYISSISGWDLLAYRIGVPVPIILEYMEGYSAQVAARSVARDSAESPNNTATPGAQNTHMSQSEIDGLRARISSCWRPPAGIDGNSKLYVVLRVLFKPDGSMAQAPVLIEGTVSPLGPALTESAQQALLSCQPFTMLRPEHYEQWKDLELKFDPHELLSH